MQKVDEKLEEDEKFYPSPLQSVGHVFLICVMSLILGWIYFYFDPIDNSLELVKKMESLSL